MANVFIQMAAAAAMMMAATRENQMRDFFGSAFGQSIGGSHRGHAGSKRPSHIIKSDNRRRNKRARLARRLHA